MSSLGVSIAEDEVRIYCQSFMKVDTEPLTTLLTILLFNGVHGLGNGEWGIIASVIPSVSIEQFKI